MPVVNLDQEAQYFAFSQHLETAVEPFVIEKKKKQYVVLSIEDYEDYLFAHDEDIQKDVLVAKKQIENGEFCSLDDL